jgi:hypothetical protein
MSRYLIYVESLADGWRLGRMDLARKVVEGWPEAVVINPENPGNTEIRDLGWRISQEGLTVECWSAKSGLRIEVDGDDQLAMLVAAWYRDVVPEAITVHFSDDMYAAHLEIPPEASASDIKRLYDEA